jgi:hypothetical protein
MQTKTGSRVVIIGQTTAPTTPSGQRETTVPQRVAPRRIVVIKNGELVGGRAGR